MLRQTLIYLPSIICILLIGLFVLARSRRLSFKSFGLFSFSLGFWLICQYLTDAHIGSGTFAIQLASAAAFLFALSFVLFVDVYPDRTTLPDKKWIILTIPALVLAPLSFTPLVVRNVEYIDGQVLFQAGPLFDIQTYTVIAYCLLGLYILVSRLKRSTSSRRSQLYSLIVAFIFGLVGNILAGFIFANNAYWQVARPLSIFFMICIIAYAMVSYKLFDIHLFVVRASAYLTTLLAITFIFIAPFVFVLNYALGGRLSTGQFILVVALSAALVYILQYLRRYFDKLTTKLFFRQYYDLQDVLDQLSNILVRTADQKVLRGETARVIEAALKPAMLRYIVFADDVKKDANLAKRLDAYTVQHGITLVDADEVGTKGEGLASALREERVALAVKLQTTHEDLGFMILGHKQSGEQYAERDKRLLSVAADEIAISLQNVLRFEEIQRFNVTLQEEVDIATRKLKRQNKRLEDLDNIKDDFISMASHQLRTPLTSVKGYLSMVIEGDAGKINVQQTKMLGQAFSSAQRMVFLITDLLNVSRLKTGKFIIDAAPVDLSETIAEEVEQLHETAQVKSIKLLYKKPKDFPRLMVDEVKIRQVIMNFIDNAIYYTQAGGSITVELEDKPSTVELRVVDNGIGVPRSEQHHLFTKFYRATNARKARPDGTGLGLFMAAKVIVGHSGSVIFNSKEGKGSTFGFSFSKSRLKVHAEPPKIPNAIT